MRKEHASGILVAAVVLFVVYYLYKSGLKAGGALSNLVGYVKNLANTTAGASRQTTGLVPATLGTVPTYISPVQGTLANTPGLLGTPSQDETMALAGVLNAPTGIQVVQGGNNGDVAASQAVIERFKFVM